MTEPIYLIQLLLLLCIANGAPVFATKLFKDRFAAPLDGGLMLPDGSRLLGASKTLRGIAVSICARRSPLRSWGSTGSWVQ